MTPLTDQEILDVLYWAQWLPDPIDRRCSRCYNYKQSGHKPDCKLAQAIYTLEARIAQACDSPSDPQTVSESGEKDTDSKPSTEPTQTPSAMYAYVPLNLAYEGLVEVICYGRGWALIHHMDGMPPFAVDMRRLRGVTGVKPTVEVRRMANPLPHPETPPSQSEPPIS